MITEKWPPTNWHMHALEHKTLSVSVSVSVKDIQFLGGGIIKTKDFVVRHFMHIDFHVLQEKYRPQLNVTNLLAISLQITRCHFATHHGNWRCVL